MHRDYIDPAGRCIGCHWDQFIPPGYEKREDYLRWGSILRATRRPSLGIWFLDHHPMRVRDIKILKKIP